MFKVYNIKCNESNNVFSEYSEKIIKFASKYTPTLFKFVTNGNMSFSATLFNYQIADKVNASQETKLESTNVPTFIFNIRPINYINLKVGYKNNSKNETNILQHLASSLYSDIYIGSRRNLFAIGNLNPSANVAHYNSQYSMARMLISFPDNENPQYIINDLTSLHPLLNNLICKKESLWAGFSIYGLSMCVTNKKSFTTSYTYITKKDILLCEVGCSGIYDNTISKDMMKEIFILSQYLSSLIGAFKYNIQKNELSILFGLSIFGFLDNMHFYNTILSMISFIINPNIIIEMKTITEFKIFKIDIVILYIFTLQITYNFEKKVWNIALFLNLQIFNKGINVNLSTKHQFRDGEFNNWIKNDFKTSQQTT